MNITPAAVWEFSREVIKRQNDCIEFCSQLVSGKVRAPTLRELCEHPPDSGDDDILYLLGKANGQTIDPAKSNRHAEVYELLHQLLHAIQNPQLLYWQSDDVLYGKTGKPLESAARNELGQIGQKFRLQLVAITPDELRAEAEKACRVLEHDGIGSQGDTNNESGCEQSANPQRLRAMQALLGDESLSILKIADSDDSADDKMREICAIDLRFLAWKSPKWEELLGVTGAAIRQTHFWSVERTKAIAADNELKRKSDH